MDIYILEKELELKCNNSTEDFLKFVLVEMQSPIEDYYIAIELLKNKYPQTLDIRIAVLGAYLSSTWLSSNENEFLCFLKEQLVDVDNQNKAIIYYLLAYDIYMKCDKKYPNEYYNLLKKSISFSQRFSNNYIRLAEVTNADLQKKKMLIEKAISNVESVWSEQDLAKLSIYDFLSYEAFLDEFILGVSIGEGFYKELLNSK